MSVITSSASILALLSEKEEALKLYALQQLNKVVHEYWYQISGAISSVEELYEDKAFSHRELAALVASKVYYHLGELKESLEYALGAEHFFDINDGSEYVRTLIACSLDQYFELQNKKFEERQNAHDEDKMESDIYIDPRLEAIVERMLERCVTDGQYEQAVGIALESKRLDVLEKIIMNSSTKHTTLLAYALSVAQNLITHRNFRREVLFLLVQLYQKSNNPDWLNICQCLMLLGDSKEVAIILKNLLVSGRNDNVLLAYQIAFDLVENEEQNFLKQIKEHLQELVNIDVAGIPSNEVTEGSGSGTGGPSTTSVISQAKQFAIDNLNSIISGQKSIKIQLNFLYSQSHADLQLLKNIKSVVDTRQSVCYSATVLANAIMHCGTTVDTFLRENLDWLSRATNWAKFSATAGLGVIHKGHLENGQALMTPYLPQDGSSGSPYSEGGALYALGLIHANHGHNILDFLLNSLRTAASEVIQHGSCLGIGIAALGTENEECFEDVKGVLYSDNAVSGEAAGIALGLIMVGSATEKATDLLAYAHETQHEKIIRGVAMGLALIMYGREESAETLIEQMTRDQDPILRYSGMFTIGLAYRGTHNNSAIQKLLHFAVSDVNDDVRRAAVLCLGFVLMGIPEQCPKTVSLLSESYNPHVRYGSAMAVGIACAGTGLKEARELLQPMLSDAIDFVRQGALIAMALVMIQAPESQLGTFRKTIEKFINDKSEEAMCRMGAIMAAGIIDAGGRNVTIGFRSSSGYFRSQSIVGMAIFAQYWYWYPLSYFISLIFTPSALIAVNVNLELPKFELGINCKESLFAYASPVIEEISRSSTKAPRVPLSTTISGRRRNKAIEQLKANMQSKNKGSTSLRTEDYTGESSNNIGTGSNGNKTLKKSENQSKKSEPDFHTVQNPVRAVPLQRKYIHFLPDSRWIPIKKTAKHGIIVVKDTTPTEPFECVGETLDKKEKNANSNANTRDMMDVEPAPPEPFEYVTD